VFGSTRLLKLISLGNRERVVFAMILHDVILHRKSQNVALCYLFSLKVACPLAAPCRRLLVSRNTPLERRGHFV